MPAHAFSVKGRPPSIQVRRKEEDERRSVDLSSSESASGQGVSHANLRRLQGVIGNRAVIRLLADAPSAVAPHDAVVIQRKIELIDGQGKNWTAMDKQELEPAFLELERCMGILHTKKEANNQRYKTLVALYKKYDGTSVKKSVATHKDLKTIVKETEFATKLAAQYTPAKKVVQDDEESESEAVAPNLLTLAGGSKTGKAAFNKGVEQKKIAEAAAASKAAADKDAAQYVGLTKQVAQARLDEWVKTEGARLVSHISSDFKRVPNTYGQVSFTSPDSTLLQIAELENANDLYSEIATTIKAAFPVGDQSHMEGYYYHHTAPQKSKGKAAFNITGHKNPHDNRNKSPFNYHVTRP